jgi:hypothetical protein
MPEPQTYANHTRFHPLFHFFAIPVFTINIFVTLYFLIRYPSVLHAWIFILSIAWLASCFLARYYGLRNQDRIIRLEERVRLTACLPPDLRGRINELSTGDLIGLRFCSDAEVVDAVRAVLAGEYKGRAEIKKRVKNWRPDYHRL